MSAGTIRDRELQICTATGAGYRLGVLGGQLAAFAPQAVLGEVRGVPVVLGALVSTPGSVVIHLYGARNETTDALDAKYETAFAAWASQAGSTAERGDLPEQPGTSLFSDITLVLSDDVGTTYRGGGMQSSGPGTQWEATWWFVPTLAKEASSVTVAIETDDRSVGPFSFQTRISPRSGGSLSPATVAAKAGGPRQPQLRPSAERDVARAVVGGHVGAAFAPQAVLGEVRGVPVVLGALVSMPASVVIHLYGARNETTDALDADYEKPSVARASQALGDPPGHPGTLLIAIALLLRDDVGTPYRCGGKTWWRGPGTEWEAMWRFLPALPRQANSVTVAIDTGDPRAQACTLHL